MHPSKANVRLLSIFLDSEGITSRHYPLCFETMWLKFEGFKDLLHDWWKSLQFSRSFSFIMESKLKAMKGLLKDWNKYVFDRVETNNNETLRRVSFF